MFIHTRGSAPKRSAKFGRQKRTFGGNKEEKAVSQIKSDRLRLMAVFKIELFLIAQWKTC